MAKFNLKRQANKADMSQPYPKRLLNKNDDRKYTLEEGKKFQTTQGMLSPTRDEGIDSLPVTVENSMGQKRKPIDSVTIESQIEKRDSYIPHRQHRTDSRGSIKPNDMLSESYDQRYYERFASEQDAADTEFWDNQIGVQLSGKKTTIVGQIPPNGSQLQNHPDRFKKVKDDNGHVDPMDSNDVLKKDKDMTYASALSDLDGKLFQLYYKAAKAGRNLTSEEKEIVSKISEDKAKILTSSSK